jgi:Xaa-Pro dipeptidase
MAKKKAREPHVVRPDDIDPHHRWDRPLPAPGHTQVDFEERIDFRRLHDYRLARTRAALANSGLGALLCFDQHNIRYTTSTVIGEWARDKLTRRGCTTTTARRASWACAAPSAATASCSAMPPARSRRCSTRREWATCRSASTSSSRR